MPTLSGLLAGSYAGAQGVQGTQGIQGISVQGIQGITGPSTTLNATDDTTTATLYPVMVGAAGSPQTPKVTTSKLNFNASTGALNVTDLSTSGTATFNGGVTSGFTVLQQNTTGEGGEFRLQKSDTNSTLAGNLTFDLFGNTLRIFENGTPFRGVTVDISAQGSQSTLLTSANYNLYAPALTGGGASGTWPIGISGFSNYSYNLTQGFNSNWNVDFTNAPAGSMISRGDTSSGSSIGGPGNTWWFQQNFRHANAGNFWGVQIAWGWEDNAHRLLTRNWQAGVASAWIEYINTNNSRSHIGSFGTGEVGTYAFLFINSATVLNPGDTIAGSSLRYTNATVGGTAVFTPPGTWRCMGYSSGNLLTVETRATVFLRIA